MSAYIGRTREAADALFEAEQNLRRLGRDAPGEQIRQKVLAAADVLSAQRRQLLVIVDEGVVGPRPRAISGDAIVVGIVELDPRSREVRVAGQLVVLSNLEFQLLHVLASDPLRVFSKAELLEDIWNYPPGAGLRSRTLDSHASRLRRKLNAGLVINCWGVGYRLCEAEAPPVVA